LGRIKSQNKDPNQIEKQEKESISVLGKYVAQIGLFLQTRYLQDLNYENLHLNQINS
jgi:hypothetical protein